MTRQAVYDQLTAADILSTFNYTLIPGLLTPVTLAHVVQELVNEGRHSEGLWLIRDGISQNTDENGWLCLHWPTYMKHVIGHHDTYGHLRNRGCSVRGLQKMALQGFEGIEKAIESYKLALSRALPPGCFLAADNPFFRRLVGLRIPVEQFSAFADSPLTAYLRDWSFIRFGALAERMNIHGRNGRLHEFLKRYEAVSDLLIGKALKNAPADTPILVIALLTALENARYCDEQTWQKWGIAWIREGLAFNYQQAVKTIRLDPALYRKVFGKAVSAEDPSADWLDPSYLTHRPPPGLPSLGVISRTDREGKRIIHKATAPYEILFQDPDPEIQARASSQYTEFQIFFKISKIKPAGVKDILGYIEALAAYNDEPAIQLKSHTDKTIAKIAKATKAPVQRKLRTTEEPAAPVKEPERAIYAVGFNGYSLGCTLPQPTDLPIYPMSFGMVEYAGGHYFAIPDSLIQAYPELDNATFYDRKITEATIVWRLGNTEAWDSYVYAVPPKMGSAYNNVHFAEVTLNHVDAGRAPLFHNCRGRRYLNPTVFRQGGEFDTVVAGILEHRPIANAKHAEHAVILATFQTLWHWVYDIRSVIAQGKVSEEFMYTVGLETNHCPTDKRLDTPTKRLQYIIDKASHSRDERVCDLVPTHDQSVSRSKKMNTYDDFVMWYATHHEIAELPWRLHPLQQAEYICKRWLPWRRPPGLVKHLIPPYKEGKTTFAPLVQMPHLLAYAHDTFGVAFTEY